MKKLLIPLLGLLLVLWAAAAGAEGALIRIEVPEYATFENRLTLPTNSTAIDFGSVRVDDWADVEPFLSQFPLLEKCDMYSSAIRPEWAETLHAAFPNVEFGWTLRIGTSSCLHYVRTDRTAFSTLHHIEAYGHTSSDFAVLRFCRNMQALDLGHNRITDISWLREMPQLKVLIIAVNFIEDISPLEDLDLEYLEMFNNYVTDISPLANQTHLLDLNIGWNSIEDLSPLYGLKQLERLWLYNSRNRDKGTPVPASDVAALKEAIPGLYVDNESTPAQGGWRVHERYYVIRSIFAEGGSYRPFD